MLTLEDKSFIRAYMWHKGGGLQAAKEGIAMIHLLNMAEKLGVVRDDDAAVRRDTLLANQNGIELVPDEMRQVLSIINTAAEVARG